MDEFTHEEKLRLTMHHKARTICLETGASMDVTFQQEALDLIGEVAWTVTKNFARDLELFARHAKRSTVNADDIKLLVRKNSALTKTVLQMATTQASAKTKRKSSNKDEAASKAVNVEEAPANLANEPMPGTSWMPDDSDDFVID